MDAVEDLIAECGAYWLMPKKTRQVRPVLMTKNRLIVRHKRTKQRLEVFDLAPARNRVFVGPPGDPGHGRIVKEEDLDYPVRKAVESRKVYLEFQTW